MMLFYAMLFAITIENPRIIHDTLSAHSKKNEQTESNFTLLGQKTFAASGTGENADIFQSTNITIKGKAKNGWQVDGHLFDNDIKPQNDIYTVSLSDVNTAYLIVHRKKDSIVLGRFNFLGKGIDGALLKYNFGHFTFKGAGGKTRGLPGVFDTTLTPPYNLPIPITLKDVDYFTIVDGTFRVFANGVALKKEEYSVDYERRILKLHLKDNPPYIHLRAEFEYHSVMDNPFIHSTMFAYKNKNIQGEVSWYSEELPTKPMYDEQGGIYLQNGGGDYEKKDSVFCYVGDGKGHYRVFFRQDTLDGSYIYDERGFYVFVGKGKGNYSPIVIKDPPMLKDVKHASIKLGRRIYTKLSYMQTENKTTLENGTSKELSVGLSFERFNMEAGMRDIKGNPIYINSYYDPTKNLYMDKPANEKFLHVGIRNTKCFLDYALSYTTGPNWYLTSRLYNLYLKSQGDTALNNAILTYKNKNSSVSLFKTQSSVIGLNAVLDMFKNTHVNGMLFEDSLKHRHHILTLIHENTTKDGKITLRFSNPDQYLLFDISSSLFLNRSSLTLSMKRTLDFETVFITRYIKTDYGSFEYDSTLSKMLPSAFGNYTRIITKNQGDDIDYVNTYSARGYIHRKTWNMGIYLSHEIQGENIKNNINLNITHNMLNKTLLSVNYETFNYNIQDKSQTNGIQEALKMSLFRERAISPSVFYDFWKDPLSGIEKQRTGIGINIKNKKLRFQSELSKEKNSLIKGRYFTLKGNMTFDILKTEISLLFGYTSAETQYIGLEKYLGVSLKRIFPFGEIKNLFSADAYISSQKEVRWRATSTLLF